jgi:hypothetical protein
MCDYVQAGLAIFGALQQSKAAKAEARNAKGVADYNARVAENRAEETRNVGVEAENVQRRKTAQLLSKQRAQLGAAGVDLMSGSAFALQEDTVALGEADALRIRGNTDSEVDSLRTSAGLTKQQGDYAVAAGNNASNAALIGGIASSGSALSKRAVSEKWFTTKSSAKQINPHIR